MNFITKYNTPSRLTKIAITNKDNYIYKHSRGQLTIKLNNIAPESRFMTHNKFYIYIKNLTFFNKIRKISKI